jgi:predicted neuraminidase
MIFIKLLRFLALIAIMFSHASPIAGADAGAGSEKPWRAGIIKQETIFAPDAHFPSCHASTVLETTDGGLLVAYFAGAKEGARDVAIWLSKMSPDGQWRGPRKIAWSRQTLDKDTPCWNPVLFRLKSGRVTLFFKQDGNWKNWKGMSCFSNDEGETWSIPKRLSPPDNPGPIKNKPVYVGDTLIAPCSDEPAPTDWRVYFWLSDDHGKTWIRTPYLNGPDETGGIQPSILIHKNGALQAVGRTPRGAGYVYQTWSHNGGKTWGKPSPLPLPNNNSGTDAVTLRDGRHLLVYNHSSTRARTPLNVAISDNGLDWFPSLVLENTPGEYSYPAIIQRKNGLVEITYTHRRKTIARVCIDPARLRPGKAVAGAEWGAPQISERR